MPQSTSIEPRPKFINSIPLKCIVRDHRVMTLHTHTQPHTGLQTNYNEHSMPVSRVTVHGVNGGHKLVHNAGAQKRELIFRVFFFLCEMY